MAVVSIENDADFSLQVLHKTGIVMVYFWASWCGPCKMVRSEIENVAEKMLMDLKPTYSKEEITRFLI